MKKLLFLTAIAVLTFNSSNAQEDTSSDEGISFGVKVGGNISNTSNGKEFPMTVLITDMALMLELLFIFLFPKNFLFNQK